MEAVNTIDASNANGGDSATLEESIAKLLAYL